MDSSVTRFKLFLCIGCCFIFFLTSCTLVKEGSDHEYVNAPEAVPMCESALREEVAFQWGWQPVVKFNVAEKRPISSRKIQVTGKAMAKDRTIPRSFDYRCVIDVRTGRIAEMELNWHEKLDHADFKELAICQDAVLTKVRRTHDATARLAFGLSDSQHLFKNIDSVTGTAKSIWTIRCGAY